MKKILFLILAIAGINMVSLLSVKAGTYFYEDNYIDNIYLIRHHGDIKYYQKARFIRQSGTGMFAYCLEPFVFINENEYYSDGMVDYNSLSSEQVTRIKLIAYFGYNYPNHYEDKWYAITQMMIWQTADPYHDFYFTDKLNGNRIEAFSGEINEINSLINNYLTLPSFANNKIDIVEDNSLSLVDTNNVLSNYHINIQGISINGNTLTVSNQEEGEKTIEFERTSNNYNYIPLFYQSGASQDILIVGDAMPIRFNLKINTEKTEVNITKIDSDTKTTTPSGEALLSGATYMLYDKNMEEIEDIEINEDMEGYILNLDYGKYYLKEIAPGLGYTLDEKIYEFEISPGNTKVDLTLENKVIEKEIEIHKNYGDDTLFQKEAGIEFEIYDMDNSLIKTIKTDNEGVARTVLPFGNYKVIQKNSTSGYLKTDDFYIKVDNDIMETIDLYDYKIKVPNTKKDKSYLLYVFVLLGLYYVKKKIFD